MIAEETNNNIAALPVLTASEGTSLSYIFSSMKSASVPFKKACRQHNLHMPLNENKLTQIYVEQVEVQIKINSFLGVKNQYSDTFGGTKGVPDFYFHKIEEGVHHLPLFIVESKVLPVPIKKREKEYVIGEKNNGGIERYKTEKHGKGLDNCGILGFVEDKTFDDWLSVINMWIVELSQSNNGWNQDEVLTMTENREDYACLESTAHRTSQSDVQLFHLWITLI
ncbi:hypothetical protein FACS1894214_2720 [Planctomycetales bacterium]|nr:hypothetical protein FACS1894214_2720 [Planctomycetales bacterium]